MATKDKASAASMAVKLTPKQESFCLAYIETGNASEAYRRSYNASRMKTETINTKAKELLKNGPVTVRIDELKAEHVERHKLTVDDLLAELEEARQLGILTEQVGAAVSATMGKAKMLGLDKQLVEHSGEVGMNININVDFE